MVKQDLLFDLLNRPKSACQKSKVAALLAPLLTSPRIKNYHFVVTVPGKYQPIFLVVCFPCHCTLGLKKTASEQGEGSSELLVFKSFASMMLMLIQLGICLESFSHVF